MLLLLQYDYNDYYAVSMYCSIYFFFLYLTSSSLVFFFFFFNDTAPPEISPLPLHAPLPIFSSAPAPPYSPGMERMSSTRRHEGRWPRRALKWAPEAAIVSLSTAYTHENRQTRSS